jgi:predicted TIM-barrel fold metal-dependent hydrolase
MRIIDVHAHVVPQARATTASLPTLEKATGDTEVVKRRALAAGITDSIILLIAEGIVLYQIPESEINRHLELITKDPHFYLMAGFTPVLPTTWELSAKILKHPKAVGIKCHSAFGQYDFLEKGDIIFDFAREHNVPIINHGQGYEWTCDPIKQVAVANRHPDVNLIVAHLGLTTSHLSSDLHIDAVKNAKHDNVFIDISFINTIYSGLVEKAVRVLGSERIVFGTDSPIHMPGAFVESVRTARFSDADKENIFHKNAERLFGI